VGQPQTPAQRDPAEPSDRLKIAAYTYDSFQRRVLRTIRMPSRAIFTGHLLPLGAFDMRMEQELTNQP